MLCRIGFFLLLAGCTSSGPEADLQYIKQARSLGAEWAAVNQQAAAGNLTRAYVASMHRWLRDGLQTGEQSLTEPDSPYGKEIRALLTSGDDASPDQLNSHVTKLKAIEDNIESA